MTHKDVAYWVKYGRTYKESLVGLCWEDM